MSKKHSTGALTKEQRQEQDNRYKQNFSYDYLIVGTGSAALTVGALLAHKGYKICMLEAHDIPGGYAHSFRMGDYSFCAQVHYTWGCHPGGAIYKFLEKIGLEKDITFNSYDPEGYDHMVMPDGKMVNVPFGYDKLAENINKAYPGQKENVLKFAKILTAIEKEIDHFPKGKIRWWHYITQGYKFINLIRYKDKTLQNVFDQCQLSKEAQAVLIANAGNFMAPPEELSIFAYVALFGGYNAGAYYPTKHYKYYVDRLVKSITDHEGCHVYYESEVVKINIDNDQVTSVETKDGKTFKAKNYICNMDPQKASEMIGRDKFPKDYLPQITYKYSHSALMIYLGLKDIDLKKAGFGGFNIWHLNEWDMNKTWKDELSGNFEKPWVFISTPSLHSSEPGITPPGGHIMEIATLMDYETMKALKDRNYAEYTKKKMEVANILLNFVEKNYVPNLRKHIAVQVIGTPSTNEDFVWAPQGNAYGSALTPKYMGTKRLKAITPWKNFWWCNASSGYGGLYGTVFTGSQLYRDLTGDKF